MLHRPNRKGIRQQRKADCPRTPVRPTISRRGVQGPGPFSHGHREGAGGLRLGGQEGGVEARAEIGCTETCCR